jgi:hypothetical protein
MYILKGARRNTLWAIVGFFLVFTAANLVYCLMADHVRDENIIVQYALFISSMLLSILIVRDDSFDISQKIYAHRHALLSVRIMCVAYTAAILYSVFADWKAFNFEALIKYSVILLFFLTLSQEIKVILVGMFRK